MSLVRLTFFLVLRPQIRVHSFCSSFVGATEYFNVIDIGVQLLVDSREVLHLGNENFVEEVHLPKLLVVAALAIELWVDCIDQASYLVSR